MMAIPANLTSVVLRGTFITPEGEPSTGTISFTPSSWLINSGANVSIPNSTITKTLGTAGDFEVTLPVTDDADVSPGDWVYSVSEVVDGVSQNYNILLPGTVGGTAYLADIAPAAAAGPEYYSLASSLTIGTVTTLAEGASATADITGLAPTQVLDLGIPVGATGTVASAGSGSVGTAAIAAAGDPNTGIYFPAADQVAITTGGTAAATFAAGAIANPTFSGAASFPDGSASAPSVTNDGDTNTGVFFPAADAVAVATGGSERLRVDSSGNVGIGSTGPRVSLDLSSSSAYLPQQYLENTNTDANPAYLIFRKMPSDNSISANDNLGELKWMAADTSGTARTAAYINVRATSQGASYVEGSVTITTTNSSGSTAEKMRVDGNGLITGTGTSLGAWTAYTPTLGGTGWAIGDGTATGAYCQVGKLVFFRANVTLGSTSTAGAGALTVSTPVTGNATQNNGAINVVIRDASVSTRYLATMIWASSSTMQLQAIGTGGAMSDMTTSAPFAWATSDSIQIHGFYQAA